MNPHSVVLTGLESAGKTALFRGLTGHATGDEANFRGSTVVCRKCRLADCGCEVVDTPGIRVNADAQTTRDALAAMQHADVVLMVARGTHAVSEVETLLRELDLQQKKTALAITFQDKAPQQIESLAQIYRERLGIPVVIVNARELDAEGRTRVLGAIQSAAQVNVLSEQTGGLHHTTVQPETTLFENKRIGPWFSLLSMAAMFALPVYAAYAFASWAQPIVDELAITPLKTAAQSWPQIAQVMLTGSYGAITLGWYSFLWAFPVVLLISASVALAEETGLKDRITAALDPWLRHIGLSGRDLIPVLSGFGCNVVAVFQSRSCSKCSRGACVSMIGFGSACSYQIGASLSLFAAAGQPGLFFPYLAALFVVGALHTRLWHGALAKEAASPLHERSFLQKPSLRAVWWRVKAALGQFLKQAMPIFIVICLVAALLEHFGVIAWFTAGVAPMLGLFHLPGEAAPGILFSILRKDGLLTLNSGDGALITAMSAGQIFVLVWLASTFTACLVTLWTVRRELGWKPAALLAGRQAVTSLVSAWLIGTAFHLAE
ncbi:nucleoside recognition domain-containing protein [Prosthecobacter sp.]|jgi:ferrous iron transport protein B|uniref:nucleoside recognition domain-containing protein n=1 Tax=Prosthecobacter sp. TaxID=1965333 RepID=UPI0037836E95